ncbi:MAG TPA: tRNA (adenosine(37)-N6)-dimethylallyltransferase MiaA [Bacillota bacterium]
MSEAVPLLVLVGPTAAGKSELALRLAQWLPVELITADSAQVYRGLDIGTAKPAPDERHRVPHHLIDVIDGDRRFSVADFQAATDAVAREIRKRGRIPVLVGGTGLYVRAVVRRYAFAEGARDAELRRRLELRAARQGSAALHAELQRVDPAAAARIHPRDTRRIVRALEVYQLTGRPLDRRDLSLPGTPYDPLVVALQVDRDRLYRRINRRTDRQVAAGWTDEVRALRSRWGPEAPCFDVLGYRELVAYVDGRRALDAVVRDIKRKTRHYARRQLTWLRREHVDHRLDVTGGVRDDHARQVAAWMAGKYSG